MKVLKDTITVTLTGTGINEHFTAVSHELVGLPAGTYHKFTLRGGAVLFYNDSGIRTVLIEDKE
jgi:hypothetical protein